MHLYNPSVSGLLGDCQGLFLAVDGVEGENAVREPPCCHEFLGGRALIGLPGNFFMRKHAAPVGQKGAQNLNGFLVLEVIETPAQHLAIKRHELFCRGATRQTRAVFAKARLKRRG